MSEPSDHRRQNPEQPSDGGNGDDEQPRRSLSLWEMITTTLWAVLGVQSSRNRERDFTHGKAIHFVAAGILFTVLFVVGMILLVNLVLSGAG